MFKQIIPLTSKTLLDLGQHILRFQDMKNHIETFPPSVLTMLQSFFDIDLRRFNHIYKHALTSSMDR